MEIPASEVVTVVLEEDGTVVDDEDYFRLGVGSSDKLMFLQTHDVWRRGHDLTSSLVRSIFLYSAFFLSPLFLHYNLFILAR